MTKIYKFNKAFDNFTIFNDTYNGIVDEDYAEMYNMKDVYIINKLYAYIKNNINKNNTVKTTCDELGLHDNDNMRNTLLICGDDYDLFISSINTKIYLMFKILNTEYDKNIVDLLETAFALYDVEHEIIDDTEEIKTCVVFDVFDDNEKFKNLAFALKNFI